MVVWRVGLKMTAFVVVIMVYTACFLAVTKNGTWRSVEGDPYMKEFLNCKPLNALECGQNKTIIPDRMCYDIPAQPYPSCGVSGFLKPKIDNYEDEDMWMIFLVKSAIPNIINRNRIRETWGTVRKIKGKKFKVIFLLGGVQEQEEMMLIREENEIFNDMLQCLGEDTYYNLPFKVLSTFRWILATGLKARYYSFCDDDVVMHMANIFVYFSELETKDPANEDVICGYHMTTDPKEEMVHRGNATKWGLDEETYDKPNYPRNCWGQLWTVSQQRISDLYCAAEVTNSSQFFIDDVLITGVLRNKVTGKNRVGIHLPELKEKTPLELLYYPLDEEDKNKKMHLLNEKWPFFNRLLSEHYFLPETSNTKIKIKMREIEYNFEARRINTNSILQKWVRYNRLKEQRINAD